MGEAKHSSAETAVLGAGCFWCVEAVFEQLTGVKSVEAGYSGGDSENPTYDDVCSGQTGHAEVARITFDPAIISFEDLLQVFWRSHDPTTLNRQGADVGSQYRSVIFYLNEEQKRMATSSKGVAQGAFQQPIMTTIEPLKGFFKAEEYHQAYYRNNPTAPYCQFVINPKLAKLKLEGIKS